MSATDTQRFEADVGRWLTQLDGHLDEYARNCAFEVAENIVVGGKYSPGTPVNTGFARNSWGAAMGDGGVGRTNPEADGVGMAGLAEMGLTIARFRLGDLVTLATNCAYMPDLEYGHSKQAPNGMIRLTAQAWPRITADIARQMGAT